MSIFWTPDEYNRPRDLLRPSQAVSDEISQWIDERALQRAAAAVRPLALRIAMAARGLTRRRLSDRLLRPAIRRRRV
jgi:hypothetical protein